MISSLYLVLIIASSATSGSTSTTHKVGLILNSDDASISSAVKDVADFTLSKLDNSTGITLITKEYSSTYLSLFAAMCALLEEGVVAFISASTSTMTAVEAEIASQFHVPFVATVATDPYLATADRDYMVLLSPSDKFQSEAIFDILKRFSWSEFTVLASADRYGMNGVVHLQDLAAHDNFNLLDVQHFDVSRDAGELDVGKELRHIKASLARVIVLNCIEKYAKTIFREAEDMGLMAAGFVWIVTDAITGHAEALAYDGSFPSYYEGIIGTVPAYGENTARYNSFKDEYITKYGGAFSNLMMSSIMASDAISIIHQSLAGLDKTEWNSSTPAVNCSSKETWKYGEHILTAITNNSFSGISGNITFDSNAASVSSYDVMNFGKNAFHKIGSWNSFTRLHIEREIIYLGGIQDQPSGFSNTLNGFHLRVGILAEDPIAYHSCPNNTTKPECWTGWNPEIIAKLADDLGFTYEYVVPADGHYGGFNESTESWSGMVRDLLENRTDLTIALSINSVRSQYIDFSESFFESKASFVVYPTSERMEIWRSLFFLLPFRIGLWASLFGSIAVIAFFVTLLSKLSPDGNYGRKMHAQQTCSCSTCEEKKKMMAERGCRLAEMECEVVKVQEHEQLGYMSFYNSLWTVATGFVQQGGETVPRALSGRFLLFFWWLFVMIIVSMYTANLTAFLTYDRAHSNIASLSDLLSQDEYSWGLISDRNLENTMIKHVDYRDLVQEGTKLSSLDEGLTKVREGGFVLIDENSVLAFNFKNDCGTILTKTDKFSNVWALGLQPNSHYAKVINRMFLQYREKGWFTEKWEEWYKADKKCGPALGSSSRFSLPIVTGLLGLLAFGIICSVALVVCETLHAAHVDTRSSGEGFWWCLGRRLRLKREELRQEWWGKNDTTYTPVESK